MNGHTFSKINIECYKMKIAIEKNKGEKGKKRHSHFRGTAVFGKGNAR